MKNYSFLESKHIYLRTFEYGDEDFFIKWYNDIEFLLV